VGSSWSFTIVLQKKWLDVVLGRARPTAKLSAGNRFVQVSAQSNNKQRAKSAALVQVRVVAAGEARVT
jgi:hypothetical protein